jgi:hypothetical protein
MKLFRGIDQGSADWFAIRLGIPTASCFDQIMTPKTRKLSSQWKGYACRLIAERLLNIPTENIQGQEWMERGKAEEPNAVKRFEVVNEVETTPITFIKTDAGDMGCSPDRVVLSGKGQRLLTAERPEEGIDAAGSDFLRLVEIKAPSLPVWLKYKLFGRDAEYECQLQGQMLISETDENVYYAYHPHAPQQLQIVTRRDEAFIRDLSAALREFNDKLHEFHQIALRLGDWQAFTRVMAPVDAELAPLDHTAEDFVDQFTDRIGGRVEG